MDVFLIILAGLCMLIGILGSILPALPGLPISYFGILLLHWTNYVHLSNTFLITWFIIVLGVTILDNILPIWTTKKLGGSKAGVYGSGIGLIIGMFIPPIGIILGALFGAIIGELMSGSNTKTSLKAGAGVFIGFIVGTVMKVALSIILLYYYLIEVIRLF